MQKIVTDVTYIKYKGEWYYLACYLDLFNNEILDWELSDTFDNFLVMKPAKRILEKAKSTEAPILFHSGQGVQYSSAGYCNLLKSYNILQSMSRAGCPRDNAGVCQVNIGKNLFGKFCVLCETCQGVVSAVTAYKRKREKVYASLDPVLLNRSGQKLLDLDSDLRNPLSHPVVPEIVSRSCSS